MSYVYEKIYYRQLQRSLQHEPPVPSPLVKSPPWINKFLMTAWNLLPLYPKPFSWVAKATKFLTVFGTTSPNRPISILPTSFPPIMMSKNTCKNQLDNKLYAWHNGIQGCNILRPQTRWSCGTISSTPLLFVPCGGELRTWCDNSIRSGLSRLLWPGVICSHFYLLNLSLSLGCMWILEYR